MGLVAFVERQQNSESSNHMNTIPPARSILSGRTVKGAIAARINIDGREYVNYFGSGYLALSSVPTVRTAVSQALEDGAPFAHHLPAALGGTNPIFEAVERAGALACATEASVYFASGYLIGMVALASVAGSFDLICLDEGAHPNLQDAVKLCGFPHYTFAHCDPESLADSLRRHVPRQQRPLVVTDGVFASTGRIAPLAEYSAALAHYDGRLLIDEAHAFGVVGTNGRGAAEFCGVESMAVIGATLSKAFCAHGALVGCSALAASRLREIPAIRGACAGSPLSAVAATASLIYAAEHPELREHLSATTRDLRTRLQALGLPVVDSPAPIVSFEYGSRADMQTLQQRLFDQGIHIYHSTYFGAGPHGIIRCAVFRDHSREDIDTLVAALAHAMR
jgi:8-amino-7-oxononanoate synthase